MKRTLQIAFTLLLANAYGQAPDIEWEKTIGGSAGEGMSSIEPTTDGGYIIGGFTSSTDHDVTGSLGQNDIWIVKMNSSGTIDWQKTIGGSSTDFNPKVRQTSDGGYIVGGTSQSANGHAVGNHGSYDIIITKLNSAGVVQWTKMLGGSDEETLGNVTQTSDGGYIVAGNTKSNDGDITNFHGSSDRWIVKLSPAGVMEWQKTYGGSHIDGGSSVHQTSDGGYITGGTSRSTNGDVTMNHGIDDIWIAKISGTGIVEWEKSLGGSGLEGYVDLKIVPSGGYIVSGMTMSNNGQVTGHHGDSDVWVVKLSDTGAIEWQKALGGSGTDGTCSVSTHSDGGYIFAGYTNSVNGDISASLGSYDIWVVKLTSAGTIQWQKSYGGSGYDLGYAISQTTDNGLIFLGGTDSTDNDVSVNYGNYDGWVVKLEPQPLSTDESINSQLVVYPNPVKNELQLSTVNNLSLNTIRIFDITGRLVIEQFGDIQNIDTTTLAAGTYVLEANSNSRTFTHKFIKQ